MSLHSGITPEKWSGYEFSQQILMIANEMHRASDNLVPEYFASLRLNYERTLRLVDLTVTVQRSRNRRKELLRWRDLIAELYIRPESDSGGHRSALHCLLLFTPESAKQIPFVCP